MQTAAIITGTPKGRRPRVALTGAALLPVMMCVGCNLGDPDLPSPRERARAVIEADVQRRFPGKDVRPITECVLDNATDLEVVTLAGSASVGNDVGAARTVAEILQRPATLRCAAATYLGQAILP